MSDAAEAKKPTDTVKNIHPSLSTNDDRPNEEAVILHEVGQNTDLDLKPNTSSENLDIISPHSSFKIHDVFLKNLDASKENPNEEAPNMMVAQLNKDLEKMRPLLVGMASIPPDEELYAYLEAHAKQPNRIKIVVDELCGANNTSPPLSREHSLVKQEEENEAKGKGGKGKKSNIFGDISTETRTPDHRTSLGKRLNCSEIKEVPSKLVKSNLEASTIPHDLADHFIQNTSPSRKRSRSESDDDNDIALSPVQVKVQEMESLEQSDIPVKFRGKTVAEIDNMGDDDKLEYTMLMSLKSNQETTNNKNIEDENLAAAIKASLEATNIQPKLSWQANPVGLDQTQLPKEKKDSSSVSTVQQTPSSIPIRSSVTGESSNQDVARKIEAPRTHEEEEKQFQEALKMSLLPENTDVTDEQMEEVPISQSSHLASASSGSPLNSTLKSPSGSASEIEDTAGPSGSFLKASPTPGPSGSSPKPSPGPSRSSPKPYPGPSGSSLPKASSEPSSQIGKLNQSTAGPSTPTRDVLPQEPELIDPEVEWQKEKEAYLLEIFPDFSPEWLLKQIQIFKMVSGTDDGRFNDKVSQIMEMGSAGIPTRKEWEKKMKEQEELDKWSGNMTVNDMLELYSGDPAKHFKGERENQVNNKLYRIYSRVGLLDAFRFASASVIDRESRQAKYSFSLAYEALKGLPNSRQTRRSNHELRYPADPCIEFMKEKKFVELEGAIRAEIVRRKTASIKAFEEAKANNALVECSCCYNECLDEDMVPCEGGHLYCNECIQRSTHVAMGDGKTSILCLGHCEEEISTRELQRALPPNILSKLLTKRQAQEVGAAEIENLVTCPFCPYSTIMENKEDKVVVCRNPECGRDSCRICKQPNHVPLRCEEVEGKDEEQIRKRVEEALSEAIIRRCANTKCPASFMKTEGCNKMVCRTCRTVQCYLCKIIVTGKTGYEHFYGQGGEPTQTRVCPLWSDSEEIHQAEISKAAQKEAAELEKEGVKLKHNPLDDIKKLEPNGKPGPKK